MEGGALGVVVGGAVGGGGVGHPFRPLPRLVIAAPTFPRPDPLQDFIPLPPDGIAFIIIMSRRGGGRGPRPATPPSLDPPRPADPRPTTPRTTAVDDTSCGELTSPRRRNNPLAVLPPSPTMARLLPTESSAVDAAEVAAATAAPPHQSAAAPADGTFIKRI